MPAVSTYGSIALRVPRSTTFGPKAMPAILGVVLLGIAFGPKAMPAVVLPGIALGPNVALQTSFGPNVVLPGIALGPNEVWSTKFGVPSLEYQGKGSASNHKVLP